MSLRRINVAYQVLLQLLASHDSSDEVSHKVTREVQHLNEEVYQHCRGVEEQQPGVVAGTDCEFFAGLPQESDE